MSEPQHIGEIIKEVKRECTNRKMTHASLCTGIGGFDISAQWMGWENIFQCEINPFCQRVLKYWFPQCELFSDIKTSDFTSYANTIDVVSSGFPCQPFSCAGKRKGTDDDRFLWAEVYRAICEIRPRWFVGENVVGLLTQQHGVVFERVCADMENAGYEVQSFVVPAFAVGAPHKRKRVFIVAHANGERLQGKKYVRQHERSKQNIPNWRRFPTQPPVCSRNDGVSGELANISFSKWRNQSISALGNAVVPQLVYEIFKAIDKVEQINNQ